MAQKPSVPKGTRDFSALEMSRRNYIFDTIRDAFRMFGYMQIETPAMENLSVLMGKYGEEGDKLLFKILNSGDFLKSTELSDFEEKRLNVLLSKMCEKGLRYDLTVPFARYVVMHRNEIQLPFKRFQIQPVWRADRPQKGRYREFYQCDADIVGSESLNNEVELIQLLDFVFKRLGIRICIKLNNRKILSGIAEILGASDKLVDITVAIDKIDKVGLENVNKELLEKGMSEDQIVKLQPFLTLSGSNKDKLEKLSIALSESEEGMKGIEELRYVVDITESLGHESEVEIDVSLARGLNYYTGTIIEVKALDVEMGSISGGGRYDNLTGVFGMPGLSGVGISFGADRIYDVLNQLDLYPDNLSPSVKVLFVNLGERESIESLKLVKKLHDAGVSCKLFPDCTKLKKQLTVANAENIPFVALIGDKEMEEGTVTLKNMTDGTQQVFSHDELIEFLRNRA